VDRHFERRIRPAEESGLRAHLAHCPLCRQRYDRHLLLGQLLPRRREDAADRLATGLGLAAVRAPSVGLRWPLDDWRWVVAGMALGVGAVVLARPVAQRARGGDPANVQVAAAGAAAPGVAPAGDTTERPLEILLRTADGLAGAAGGALDATDRVVFAVRNDRWRYLTIAGLDQAGAVHVLSPTRAITRAPGLQLLPERQLPPIDGTALRVVTLLTDRALAGDELARALRGTLAPIDGVRAEIALVIRARRGP
jgi:hypothetical protein